MSLDYKWLGLGMEGRSGSEEVDGLGLYKYLEGKANSLAARMEIGAEGKRRVKNDCRFLQLH